jgi:hypothetical protein
MNRPVQPRTTSQSQGMLLRLQFGETWGLQHSQLSLTPCTCNTNMLPDGSASHVHIQPQAKISELT